MKISILHPSRGRPAKSWQCMNEWINRAGCEVEVIVSLDTDDPSLTEYVRIYGERFKLIINSNRSAVDAMNQAAQHSTGDILVGVSDDFACPKNWALILLKHAKTWKDFVLKVNDGTQSYIVTLPIMDRTYYNRFGYIYHPDYLHMFCDTELTHVADCLRRLIIKNDLLFRHNHYSVLREPKDHIARRADATWNEGKRIYLEHCKNKFGLHQFSVDVTSLAPEGLAHKQWLKNQGIW